MLPIQLQKAKSASSIHIDTHTVTFSANLITAVAFLSVLAVPANATLAPLLHSVHSYLFLNPCAFIVLFKEDGTRCPPSTPPHLMLMLHSGSK